MTMHQGAGEPSTPPTYEGRLLADPSEPVYDQGLQFDVETLLHRRQVLKLIGLGSLSAGLVGVVGCAPSGSAARSSAAASAAQCRLAVASRLGRRLRRHPRGDRRPVPGRRLERPHVLTQSGVVRSDIRSSFGVVNARRRRRAARRSSSTIQDAGRAAHRSPAPPSTSGTATRDGNYSLYSQAATERELPARRPGHRRDGVVTFTSIFPACYSGRWPHIHFEVYPEPRRGDRRANKIATSQIALPEDVCDRSTRPTGYEPERPRTWRQVSLASRHGLRRRRRGSTSSARCRGRSPAA